MQYAFLLLAFLVFPTAALAQASVSAPVAFPPPGRYQLVVVPSHSGSPFLLDTLTGCVWHIVQNPETRRSTFVEVDVENLHWSWGSGAQQLLASRIDSSNLTDEQKRALKQELQRSGCGFSNVVLTPSPVPTTGPAPPASTPTAPAKPKR
jgi:hypothetical protein